MIVTSRASLSRGSIYATMVFRSMRSPTGVEGREGQREWAGEQEDPAARAAKRSVEGSMCERMRSVVRAAPMLGIDGIGW